MGFYLVPVFTVIKRVALIYMPRAKFRESLVGFVYEKWSQFAVHYFIESTEGMGTGFNCV